MSRANPRLYTTKLQSAPTNSIQTAAPTVQPVQVKKTYEEAMSELQQLPLYDKIKIVDTPEIHDWILAHKSLTYFNALGGDMSECNIEGVAGMFHRDQRNEGGNKIFNTQIEPGPRTENFIKPFLDDGSMHIEDGVMVKKRCAIYCAHDTCSAAATFLTENKELFDTFCSEIHYLKNGIRGITTDYHKLVKKERVENEKKVYVDTGVKLVNRGNCLSSLNIK